MVHRITINRETNGNGLHPRGSLGRKDHGIITKGEMNLGEKNRREREVEAEA
jgi:hypothetical protein